MVDKQRLEGVKLILAFLAPLAMGACALLPLGNDDSASESSWATIRVANENGSTSEWSVADRAEGRALVSVTATRAVSLSVAGTLVLSPSVFLPEQGEFQKALLQYFIQTDRPSCRILSGAQTTRFQYEFKYDCMGR